MNKTCITHRFWKETLENPTQRKNQVGDANFDLAIYSTLQLGLHFTSKFTELAM